MKKFFSFLRIYYGSLIGVAVGLLLMAMYYYLILQEPTASNTHILSAVELLTPSIDSINNILASVMGAATFLFWIFAIFSVYLIIFIHVVATIFIYGFTGFCIHYLLAPLARRRSVIDKNTQI